MALPVSLRSVVEELDALMDECTAYLNRATGELYALRDEEAALVEDGVDPDSLADWQRDELPKVREVLGSADWLALPTRFDIHEWTIMDEFARSIDDPDVAGELTNAIRGAGAFRSFRDAIHRCRIHDSWYRYRTAALGRIASDWLDEHAIPFARDEDAAPGG